MQSNISGPFFGLLSDQPTELVDAITRREIINHRRLGEEAEILYDRLRRSNEDPAVELDYLSKMVELYAQQTALSELLDILGYIPDVPPAGAQ